jgi:hypothetical protein
MTLLPSVSASKTARKNVLGIAGACALLFAIHACSRGSSGGNDPADTKDAGASQDATMRGEFDLRAPQADASGNGDLSAASDGSIGMPDSASLPDMASPPDLTTPPDLTPPPDLTTPPDLRVSTDPFDPASCTAPAMASSDALTLLGSATRINISSATLMTHTRTCTGMTADTCGAWLPAVVYTRNLLTYSGGSSTEYKNFSYPTYLTLFKQSGVPKFSVRHQTDYDHDATLDANGIVFPFGSDPMVVGYPDMHVWDSAPKMYHYQDLYGQIGLQAELHAAAHCARLVVTNGITTEIAALYQY